MKALFRRSHKLFKGKQTKPFTASRPFNRCSVRCRPSRPRILGLFFSVSRHYSDALSVRLLSLTMQTSIVTKMTSLLDMFDRSGHNATTLNLTWDILPDHFKNEYVEVALAKEPYSVFSNVLMTCFYVVILVFGMVGNFMTLIVISWEKGTKSPANLFLISLSLADIITLLIGNIFEFNFGNF